ncbi:MAG: hypothetical protein M5U19_15700 [Microthrixaceae bacterium]|nr:hypothetical protein [Microthrixaceae bacterium]
MGVWGPRCVRRSPPIPRWSSSQRSILTTRASTCGTATGVDADLGVSAGLDALVDRGVEVAVDFTEREAGRENLRFLASAGIHAVVGTTGFTEDDLARFRKDFDRSNALIAPNSRLERC